MRIPIEISETRIIEENGMSRLCDVTYIKHVFAPWQWLKIRFSRADSKKKCKFSESEEKEILQLFKVESRIDSIGQ